MGESFFILPCARFSNFPMEPLSPLNGEYLDPGGVVLRGKCLLMPAPEIGIPALEACS